MESIRFTNTLVDEIGIDDSSRYPPDEFLQEDDPSRRYQVDFYVSYYILPHGRSLTELTQENHVPEVIAPNEPDIPHTEDTKGPPDLINTEGTLPDVIQSHISNQASISFHPVPQDRWSRDQHIELVNIIGDPGEGILTRSMAVKLTAALANFVMSDSKDSTVTYTEDEVLLADEQPLPTVISPTADSSGYITESNPGEDPKKDDKDPEEDPADYPTDREDDEEEGESYGDDVDDEEEDKDEDKEEEEHPALADSIPPPTARMAYRDQTLSIPVCDRELESPSTSHHSTTITMYFHNPGIMWHDESCCTIHLHLSILIRDTTIRDTHFLYTITTPSPPLLLPSTNCRAGVSKVTLPPQKRLCIVLGLRFEVGKSSSAPIARPTGDLRRDYSFVAILDDEIRQELDRDVGYGITDT
ncbi:hypothetical protein Tco_0888135 [Tanacetum coccineum]